MATPRGTSFLAVLAVIALTAGLSPAAAQTVIFVDASATGAGNGSSWADAYTAVQPALNAAEPGDQVWVAAGTYVENITLALGVGLYGGFAGTEDAATFDLADRDLAANQTILDGNRQTRVVTSPTGATDTTRIDGFSIRNGFGSGIYCDGSSPTIANNTIRGNQTFSAGGGVYLNESSAIIVNNTITGNSASSAGGGVYGKASSPTIANNTIVGNSANHGGALYLEMFVHSTPAITNTIIAFNSSGIYATGSEGTNLLRHNCVYGNLQYDYSGLADPTGIDGNISADPRLASWEYGNVHIQPDSPCVNAGDNAYAYGNSDVDGQPRIQPLGGTVDIGADESDGTTWPAGPYAVVRVSPTGDDDHDGSSWELAKRTVQAGMDAASRSGGEVWVQAGRYEGCLNLDAYAYVYGGFTGVETQRDERDWNANETILDGLQQDAVVTARAGYRVSAIDGFTITNGAGIPYGAYPDGGGMYLSSSASPIIANNTITGNNAASGGGISMVRSFAIVANNRIRCNSATMYAGGLNLFGGTPRVVNNEFSGNSAQITGAVRVHGSSGVLANNTILGNSAVTGGALFVQGSSFTIANNIIAFNSSGVQVSGAGGLPALRHNCVYGNDAYNYDGLPDPTGTDGNISADPQFAGWEYGNLHIQPGSPCVDAGDNVHAYGDFDVDGQPRVQPAGGTVDIGADESDGTTWPAGPYAIVRVSPAGDNANDGSSWLLAKHTVQAGIDAACASGGEVWVQAGTYPECINLHRYSHVYGGFAGTETHRHEREWNANVTILDGQNQGSVVTVDEGGYALSTVDGFTITNGSGTLSDGDDRRGGGFYVYASAPTVANNIIEGNTANLGGGLYSYQGHPTITGNRVTGNHADSGAGLYLELAHAHIVNNSISQNIASGEGGGLYLKSASPSIRKNTISRNIAAASGGGLHFASSSPDVVNNTITRNSAGAVFVYSGSPTLVNNTITWNTGSASFGGLYLGSGAGVIANTIIAYNSAGLRLATSAGQWTLRHNCVYDNYHYDYRGIADPTGTDGNLSADPRLASREYGNLHIQPDSPCVDAGDNALVSVDTDVDGQPRIQPAGGTVDIGADESDGTTWSAGPYVIVRVSPTGNDANDGSSWPLAKRTVQAGIEAAAALGGDVWVQTGTYPERIMLLTFVHVYGGFAGNEENRHERDFNANITTLDGQQQGSVVTAEEAGDALSSVDGFTITNGSGTVSGSFTYGGGVYLRNSSPTVAHNRIMGNNAHLGGGLALNESNATIVGNSVVGNEAHWGGGLEIRYGSPAVQDNVIADNTATSSGGGVYYGSGSASIVYNRVTRNRAPSGGGFALSGGSPTIANNAITGNIATGNYGGGFYALYASPVIKNNTITANRANNGGGLYFAYSSLALANTIIAFNSSGVGQSSGTPVLRNNCVYGNTTYDYSGLPDPTGIDGNISADPRFVQTPDPGPDGAWATDDDLPGDLHLVINSPCIDAGDNADAFGDFDLDGLPRIAWCNVDMGAHEHQGPFGDFFGDCDVDLDDYALFEVCLRFSGPDALPPFAECLEVFDFDLDFDVDLTDFAVFQLVFTQP